MIDLLRHLFAYMSHESCGKCTPCRIGTQKGAQMLLAATPDNPVDLDLMRDLLELLETGSLCALGGGLPLPIRNALDYFQRRIAKPFHQLGGVLMSTAFLNGKSHPIENRRNHL